MLPHVVIMWCKAIGITALSQPFVSLTTLQRPSMVGRLTGVIPMALAARAGGMPTSMATTLTQLPVLVGMTELIPVKLLSSVCKEVKALPIARLSARWFPVQYVQGR